MNKAAADLKQFKKGMPKHIPELRNALIVVEIFYSKHGVPFHSVKDIQHLDHKP